MRFHPLHLLPQVGLEVVEGVEMGGLACDNAHFFGQMCPQLVFLDLQQAAVGVIDDDELLGVEQVMGNDQRAQRIVGCDSAGIADHVSVTGVQSEAALEEDSGVHAGEHCHSTAWFDRQISKIEILNKFRVGFEQFVCD